MRPQLLDASKRLAPLSLPRAQAATKAAEAALRGRGGRSATKRAPWQHPFRGPSVALEARQQPNACAARKGLCRGSEPALGRAAPITACSHALAQQQNAKRKPNTGQVAMVPTDTVVEWQGCPYRQKSGTCIGSRVAPAHIAQVDRGVHEQMKGIADGAFRFAADWPVVADQRKDPNRVVQLFTRSANGFNFTMETPKEGAIQFLDSSLNETMFAGRMRQDLKSRC